VKEKNK